MNLEIKKLKRSIYIAIICTVGALLIFLWFYTRSLATFRLDPSGARLFIDGQLVKTPASGVIRKNLSPGDHTITSDSNDYTGYSKVINFKRGFMKEILISLYPIPQPTMISDDAKLLVKGNNFNDFYYLGNNGKTLFKTKIGTGDDGKINIIEQRAITEARFSKISDIIWSPNKDLALLRKEDGSITLFDFMRYDFIHQTETPWGNHIGDIAWSPDNSKIAYYYTPLSGEKSLVFTNVNNSEINRVLNLKDQNIENPILKWSPDSEWLIIIPRNEQPEENKIYAFNTYSRELNLLTDMGNQMNALFSPDSNKIVYSTFSKDPSNPVTSSLSIMDKDGSNKQSLNIHAEIGKVFWNKDSKNLVISTVDMNSRKESIFQYNTSDKHEGGFFINSLGEVFVKSLMFLDDNKSIVYEANGKIYGIKVQ